MVPYEIHFAAQIARERRILRRAATEAGLFSGGCLSHCRRAKQYLGRHPDAEIGID